MNIEHEHVYNINHVFLSNNAKGYTVLDMIAIGCKNALNYFSLKWSRVHPSFS
jgi:hypothetical protein